ncbi:MAG TPA: DUF2167 domain-containing protein [Gemmatimonadaceae bacterium]|nr:DUF2167 domain-containing protein [Gemmatimonadaceae bacterium]
MSSPLCRALLGTLVAAGPVAAQQPTAADSAQNRTAQFEASLLYREGTITLKDGLATLTLPQGYRYLGPEDTERVLVEWGNPPGSATLGMIVPGGLGATDEESWAVIVSFDEDGYVEDDEAASIDYDELLRDMQKATRDDNKARTEAGYAPVDLVGWAARPHYDSTTRKLYWAKELQFGQAPERTLNYDVRALGRRGVLVLSAVAAMKQLTEVETGMQQVLGFVAFNEGHRYADYIPGTDKVAAYGIGALIAGKVAAKAGLFKLLIGVLAAAKKLIVIGLVAIAELARRFFRRKHAASAPSASP